MIYLVSDHAGFELKEEIKKFLKLKNIVYEDLGAHKFEAQDDYPDFILPAAKKVAENSNNKGIILGGSGQGEAVVANKVKGIRAVVYYGGPKEILKLSREHNNANILSLGARFLTKSDIPDIIETWINTEFFKAERHTRRIQKISKYEENYVNMTYPNLVNVKSALRDI